MKARDSGMPEELMWSGFFTPDLTLKSLGLTSDVGDVVDFGCGYGTFTIPAAKVVKGTVYAFDIEPEMIASTEARAREAGLRNVRVLQRDFIAEGTGLPDASVDYAMLFNILHCENPELLLNEAWRNLSPGGLLAVTHWRYDASTPRGPSMSIRPRPGECLKWVLDAGFQLAGPGEIDLPPYHYGLVLSKP